MAGLAVLVIPHTHLACLNQYLDGLSKTQQAEYVRMYTRDGIKQHLNLSCMSKLIKQRTMGGTVGKEQTGWFTLIGN